MPDILHLLNDQSYQVRRSVLHAVRVFGEPRDGELLVHAAKTEDDPEMKVAMLSTAPDVGAPGALFPLIEIIRQDGIFADEAYHALHDRVEFEFTKSEIENLMSWLTINQHRLIWDTSTKRFIIHRGREKHG